MGVARRQPGTTGSHKQVPQQQPQQARSPPAWRCVARVSRVGRKRASVAAAAGSRQAAAGLLGCTSCQRPAVPVWMPPPPHAGVHVENTVEAMQALITEDNGPRGPVAELHFVEVDIQASLAHPGNCTAEPRNSVLHRSSRHTAPIRFSRLDWCVHLAACCLLPAVCVCVCVCRKLRMGNLSSYTTSTLQMHSQTLGPTYSRTGSCAHSWAWVETMSRACT